MVLSLSAIQAQFTTQSISAEEANSEAANSAGDVGFSSVYFSNMDLRQLLLAPNAAGVRFYTAKDGGQTTLIATPIDGSGQELGSYFKANGFFSVSISQSAAKQSVESAKQSPTDGFAVNISSRDLQGLMTNSSTTGVSLKPANEGGSSTLTLAPTTLTEFGSQESMSGQIKSSAPCPNACGNGTYLTSFE